MLLVIQLLSFHKKPETIVVRRFEDLKNVGEDVLQSEIHPRRLKALESTTKGNASNPRGVPTNSTATTKEHSIQNQNLPPSISQKEEEIEEESELLNVIALPKFKVKVVSGKTMAEVHVNGQLVRTNRISCACEHVWCVSKWEHLDSDSWESSDHTIP